MNSLSLTSHLHACQGRAQGVHSWNKAGNCAPFSHMHYTNMQCTRSCAMQSTGRHAVLAMHNSRAASEPIIQ